MLMPLRASVRTMSVVGVQPALPARRAVRFAARATDDVAASEPATSCASFSYASWRVTPLSRACLETPSSWTSLMAELARL